MKNKKEKKYIEEANKFLSEFLENEYENIKKKCTTFKSKVYSENFPYRAYKYIKCDEATSYGDYFACIYQQYYGVIHQPKKPFYLAEKYFRRNGIIDRLVDTTKIEDPNYDELKFAQALNNIIKNEFISLEATWCMEFEIEDDGCLNKDEKEMLTVFEIFMKLYLFWTDDICKKYKDDSRLSWYQIDDDDFITNNQEQNEIVNKKVKKYQ